MLRHAASAIVVLVLVLVERVRFGNRDQRGKGEEDRRLGARRLLGCTRSYEVL